MNEEAGRQRILTFPPAGYAAAAAELFLRDAGIRYVTVPADEEARKTEAFRSAPEGMCLPFKLFAAQLEQAWKRGADTAVMTASKRFCHLGEFCELLRVMMENLGCRYDWILLDTPSDIGVKELIRRVMQILPEEKRGPAERKNMLIRLNRARHLLGEMERFTGGLRREAGYCENPGKAAGLISECRREVREAESLEKAFEIMGHFRWEKSQLKKDFAKNPVKILLTGELFALNEPAADRGIEDRLTEMGVCLEHDITAGWRMRRAAADAAGYLLRDRKRRVKKTYIPCDIGGYARQNVEYAASAGIRGFDGVIHVFPSGCMPETAGDAAMTRIGEKENIPVMTLICDETGAEAGVTERLEAFSDMLQKAKGAEHR